MTITLRMLGGIGLSTEGGMDVDAILRQPKRVALMAYLAMPVPGTWHRRDELVGIFWADHDQVRARTALRSALYSLRRQLPDDAIQTRGDDEVTVNPSIVSTDVAEFTRCISAGRHAEALGVYLGDFLPSLHIGDAAGFEKWVEIERARLRNAAGKAAAILSENLESDGNIEQAVEAAKRACELDPEDESAARRWIGMLDRIGDRAQAFAVYQRFRNHVAEELGIRPSAETVALVDAIRTRHIANERAARVGTQTLQHNEPIVEAKSSAVLEASAAPEAVEPNPEPPKPAQQLIPKWLLVAVGLIVLAVMTALVNQYSNRRADAPLRVLVVLPMENETGDPKMDYVASGIAAAVAERLRGLGGMSIRSGARSAWPVETRHDYRAIARAFGSTILLRTTLAKVGDLLEVRASVIDAGTMGERSVGARRFAAADVRDAESLVAAAVAGTVFRVPLPSVPRAAATPVDANSYRIMLEGWHELLVRRNNQRAITLFQDAVKADNLNARAWSGLSSAWSNWTVSGRVPFEVGYDHASAAAARALALDSLQGSAWANLAFLRALQYQSLALATDLLDRATAAEPANPEIFLVKAAIYRQAHDWENALHASRVARAMDPLNPLYADREAIVYLCADKPEAALRVYESYLKLSPQTQLMQSGKIRTLARLNRYPEAISEWTSQARAHGDTATVKLLASAGGRTGYWAVRHVQGKEALRALLAESKGGWVAPTRQLQALFFAGDFEKGFRMLEQAEPEHTYYHLPCMPGLDEVRDDPRFKAAVNRFGAMPKR